MEEESPPVLVQMDVHCERCAVSICGTLRCIHGVYDVCAHVPTGMVAVRCSDHLDPATLKCHLERFTEERRHRRYHHGGRSRVKIVAEGGRPVPRVEPPIDHNYYPYYDDPPYHHQQHWTAPPPYHQPVQYGPAPPPPPPPPYHQPVQYWPAPPLPQPPLPPYHQPVQYWPAPPPPQPPRYRRHRPSWF